MFIGALFVKLRYLLHVKRTYIMYAYLYTCCEQIIFLQILEERITTLAERFALPNT